MHKRSKSLIEKVLKEYPDKTVLLVAHNAINKALIKYIKKIHPEDKGSLPQDNTAITIFEISGKECKEILFNCTKHLE